VSKTQNTSSFINRFAVKNCIQAEYLSPYRDET